MGLASRPLWPRHGRASLREASCRRSDRSFCEPALIRLAVPLLLRTDPELALYGRYVVSKRLKEEGFEFRFPELRVALREVINGGPALASSLVPP